MTFKYGQNQLAFLISLLLVLSSGIWFADTIGSIADNIIFVGLIAVLLILLSAYFYHKQSPRIWLSFLGIFFILGILRFTAVDTLPINDISKYKGQVITIEGSITEEIINYKDYSDRLQDRYTIQAEYLLAGNDIITISGKAYIYVYNTDDKDKSYYKGNIGDKIRVTGKVRGIRGYKNTEQIDINKLLKAQGITASISTSSIEVEPSHNISMWDIFKIYASDIKSHYRASMNAVMPDTDASTIYSMLFGGYAGLRTELLEVFSTTGIIHILSVSGSHITLIAAVVVFFISIFRVPKTLGVLLLVMVILFYVTLAGFVPTAVRAGIMGWLSFLGLALGRERDSQRILIITAIMMLIYQPLLLFHISFQLSFMSTVGLLFITPKLRIFFRKWFKDTLALSMSITIATQVTTLPIIAWYFNKLSLSSLIANIVVLPPLELIIILGLLGGLIAFVLPFFSSIIFSIDSLLLGLTYEVARIIANLPVSTIWLPTINPIFTSIYYISLTFISINYELRNSIINKFKPYVKEIVISVAMLVIVCLLCFYYQPKVMEVHFIDVGQGDAALVITPNGHAMMFDTGGIVGGNIDIGKRVDVPYILHHGIRKLDYLFLSHSHEDHAGGAGSILKSIPVDKVYIADEGLQKYAHVMKIGSNDPLLYKLSVAKEGNIIELDGVNVETLYTPIVDKGKNGIGNEFSNVYRLSFGEVSFLFTGDLVAEHEKRLIKTGKNIKSTVLKVPHHGSASSSTDEFIDMVTPSYAVYSVGDDNRFGHPDKNVIEKIEKIGAISYRTDWHGAITFVTDGKNIKVKTYSD